MSIYIIRTNVWDGNNLFLFVVLVELLKDYLLGFVCMAMDETRY